MRRSFLLVILLGMVAVADAQSGRISGTVKDNESGRPLAKATVRLFNARLASPAGNTITDSLGLFSFSNLPADSFLLSITYTGYKEVSQYIKLDSVPLQLDISAVPGSSTELANVTIRVAVPAVTQKGDTLQVNADQFKVNRDASAEDLVRKVPGVTIENGQVKAQGEVVQKVTLDGRDLFGDDATAALRNLPAEIIDKIQIFDRLSDQAQFSGFDDGSASRSINIVTRANMRNGQFGRVYAGMGNDERYQAGGNATILHENRRISLVGNFNNINQQNFAQEDLLGVTSSGGGQRGGNFRGGGGRGGGRDGGGGRPGGFGGFGNASNFMVGAQNGINRTNAFGINYADLWGSKWTVSGSYFYNNTRNNTFQLGNTRYLAGTMQSSLDTSSGDAGNTNHRLNMRLEYRIDSSNSLIIMPNISLQQNTSDRFTGRDVVFAPGLGANRTLNRNTSNSDRFGSNLRNSILYRHSFPKRGRTFSVNLNTSFNENDGESYVNTFQRIYRNGGWMDTSSQRFTDQLNNGLNISANFNYTEPVSENSQLQFSYNPSWNRSKSDQETFGWNSSEGKYSRFLDSLSNRFNNLTTAQSGGVAWRWGDRDRQISTGVNYQHTNLRSDQVFPRQLQVDKSFGNVLPNAMIRYKFNTRNSVRLFYRSRVNTPSVTQLQNVIDISNAPYYAAGNPLLEPMYMNIMSTQYTYTNTSKGFLLVGNVFYQHANNYITNATFTPGRDTLVNGQQLRLGDQLTKPVNLDGYSSIRSFLTLALPLPFIKSNFNLNGGLSVTNTPGIFNNISSETKNKMYSAGAVLASNVSEYVDFTVSYTANFNQVRNAVFPAQDNNYFQHSAGLQVNLLSKTGWVFRNDLSNEYYSGLSEGFNQNYYLWNMSLGKKFLKDQKGELRFSVFDLLKQNQSIQRSVTEAYIEDLQNQVLQQYFMLTFTYNLRNFGKAPQRQAPRPEGRPWMRHD